jgi:hypothetical protein
MELNKFHIPELRTHDDRHAEGIAPRSFRISRHSEKSANTAGGKDRHVRFNPKERAVVAPGKGPGNAPVTIG